MKIEWHPVSCARILKSINMETQVTPHPEQSGFILEEVALMQLKHAARWAKFLAIIGFIGLVLMFILSIFLSYTIRGLLPIEQSSGFSSVAYAFTYLILALIYFIPLLYLYQFAVNTQRAIHKQQSHELTYAFSRLKSFYQYLGILTIICIAFYVVVVIGVYIGLKMS